MTLCEFCRRFQADGKCGMGLRIPTGMRCQDFDPGIEKFCADPADFKGAGQIIQMGTYFGVKGKELKKIKQIATQEEEIRSALSAVRAETLARHG